VRNGSSGRGSGKRRAGTAFPTEQAAMKIPYLTVKKRRPNRANQTRRSPG